MWLTKEEAKKFCEEKIKYKPMAKMVAEHEKIPITGSIKSNDVWCLVNKIIIEKWSINGVFRGGDLSEDLLKEIRQVLRKKVEDELKGDGLIKRLLEWEPIEQYKRDFDGP